MVDFCNYFVLKNRSVCGAIGMEFYEEEAEIVTLAIEKGSRGKGFGRKLVDFAIDEARGVKNELLTIGSARKYNAEDFYLKCGFKLDYSDDEYHVFSMKL
jgi:GNAT superfamily N-acetyltransferase